MTENAGIDETIADQQSAAPDTGDVPDQTQVAEDPTGETAAYAGLPDDPVGEPDEVH